MRGRPALAITAERMDELLETLYHAPADTPDPVDIDQLVGSIISVVGPGRGTVGVLDSHPPTASAVGTIGLDKQAARIP